MRMMGGGHVQRGIEKYGRTSDAFSSALGRICSGRDVALGMSRSSSQMIDFALGLAEWWHNCIDEWVMVVSDRLAASVATFKVHSNFGRSTRFVGRTRRFLVFAQLENERAAAAVALVAG